MSPTFTLFNNLPSELRHIIWRLSLPDDEPEVFILRRTDPQCHQKDDPPRPPPMTVDTAFPALMHVCHESRSVVLQNNSIRFRFSAAAGCDVPCRQFRPELDTLFWNGDLQQSLWGRRTVSGDADTDADTGRLLLPQLRHLALPSSSAFCGQLLTDCIMGFCPALRSLSVVFADSADGNWVKSRFRESGRRCKLRRIQSHHARVMTVVMDTSGGCEPEDTDRVTLEGVMDRFREDLERNRKSSMYWHEKYTGRPWSTMLDSPAPKLDCFAATFVEWRGGGWVEVCGEGGRMYPSPMSKEWRL